METCGRLACGVRRPSHSKEIVEHGAHDELVDADGRCAMMYRQQYWLDEEGIAEDEEGGPPGEEVASTL